MAGRPSKPIEFKKLDGNTRKLSKAKYEAEINAVIHSEVGEPPYPAEMLLADTDTDDALKIKADFERRWNAACAALRVDNLLYVGHAGIIKAYVQAQMMADTAFFSGDWRAFESANKQVMQISTLTGLNASGAAKIPNREAKADQLEAILCG